MSTFKKYPAVVLLPRRPQILSVKEVVATEKIHGCLTHKARVAMADGTFKAISVLKEGDQLLGVDGEGVTTSEVVRVFRNGKADKWLKIGGKRQGAGRGNHSFSITCTPEHNIWLANEQKYVTAGELRTGDRVTLLRSGLRLTPLQEQVLLEKLGDGSLAENEYKPALTEQGISSIEEDTKISSERYDIETTTHNYFANGVLVHNSNFRIGFPLGMADLSNIRFGSRELDYEDPKFSLPRGVEWFQARPELLARMWDVLKSYGLKDVVVFGEIFGPGVQAKGVRYAVDGDQQTLFRAFDIMVGEDLLTYDLFCEVADKMGLPRVPEVWRGAPSIDAFDALLDRVSAAALENGVLDDSNLAEGVVIRSNPLLRTHRGDWLIVKHKTAKFSEVAHAPTGKRIESPADAFAQTYVTEGRIRNASGRLQERGVALSNAMQDVPNLTTEVIADLRKESDWPEGFSDKQMSRPVSRVLGPIYRSMLERDFRDQIAGSTAR